MNSTYQSITNKKEINLAFIKLSIDDDDQKYIWNGTGDGLSFRIAMIEIVNRFAEKDFKRFLDGPVHEEPPPPLPTESVWITTQMNELEKIVTEYRLLQYNQVGSRYGFPAVNNLNIGFNIASLLPEDQVRIRNEVYKIEDDYDNDMRDIRLKYSELSQNYFDLARMHRRKNEKILNDRINCAALFRELISPDCLYCCYKELGEHAFHIAWQRLCNTYNTIPDSEVRLTVFNKIMNMVYRPEEQTLVEFFQEMEQLWSLLLVPIPAPPLLYDTYIPKLVNHPPPVEVEAGGLSNGERIEFIRRALCKSTKEFNNVLQHCKWTNKTYDETKALLLETNQENINNYLEQLQSSNAETQPICYKCGKQGHKSYQCESGKITTYNFNTKEPIVNVCTTSTDGHMNGYKSDSSVYSRSSRDGSNGSEKSRNLKSKRSNKSKKGKNSYKKRVTFEDREKSYRKSRNQSSFKW